MKKRINSLKHARKSPLYLIQVVAVAEESSSMNDGTVDMPIKNLSPLKESKDIDREPELEFMMCRSKIADIKIALFYSVQISPLLFLVYTYSTNPLPLKHTHTHPYTQIQHTSIPTTPVELDYNKQPPLLLLLWFFLL